MLDKLFPRLCAFSGLTEGLEVSEKNHSVLCSREHDVHTLWLFEEANVSMVIAPDKRYDNDLAFFSLKVINSGNLGIVIKTIFLSHRNLRLYVKKCLP